MRDLGAFPGGFRASASDVSADGSVIVGVAEVGWLDFRAFRWTPSGGMQNLGQLGLPMPHKSSWTISLAPGTK